MNVAFIPNGLRYLVLPDEPKVDSETIGEITISGQPDIHKKASEGTVVAIGDGERIDTRFRFCKYNVGHKLVYGQYSGYEQEFDGKLYKVLSESEILGQRVTIPESI